MFDLILLNVFKTTFLRAHSWLNWVYEDDDEDDNWVLDFGSPQTQGGGVVQRF